MSLKEEIRQFLVARRANVSLSEVALPETGGERRVPGLRREEVADLAGVSTDYYTRLERGGLPGASDSVINSIARALRLTDVERTHLFALARSTTPRPAGDAVEKNALRPSVQRLLDSFTAPAIVYNSHQDLIAANATGRALYSDHFEADPPNMARYIFLDSRARHFYDDWPLACSLTAAMLRYEAGKDPLNAEMTSLIGELSTRSPQFRTHWADQDVHEHRTGQKTYHHQGVGELELTYEVLDIPGMPGFHITTYTAEPGSASADKLTLLGTWTATLTSQQ